MFRKNRCLKTVVLSLLASASVFFISCGIPIIGDFSDHTWITEDTTLELHVNSTDLNLIDSDGGTGLVLFYYLSNDDNLSASSFNFPSSITGKPFSFKTDEPFIYRTSTKPPLTAFLMNRDKVSTPIYHMNLDLDHDTSTVTFQINWDNTTKKLTLNGNELTRLNNISFTNFDEDYADVVTEFASAGKNIFLHIFSCFTAIGQFTNYYVSPLKYLYSIKIN